MKFRKVRMAWSVLWGVCCLLLIVFWVRSYYFADLSLGSLSKWWGYQLTTTQGELTFRLAALDGAGHHGEMEWPDSWLWTTTPAGATFEKSPDTFGFHAGPWGLFVMFPYWAPLLVWMVLAAAPMAICRQRLHFSLRTLLIGTTIIAVALSLVVYAASQ